MKVRVGLPHPTGKLPCVCFDNSYPAMVSANSMWTGDRFRTPCCTITDLDVALDSAGYVAMKRYGGYRWSVSQYVELAALGPWAWWAQMDITCEPDLSLGATKDRLWASAWHLGLCRKTVTEWTGAHPWLRSCLTQPVPVLQGWNPDDYLRCIDLYDQVLPEWPDLVGVGSMCRRPVGEILAVVSRLHRVLPAHSRIHLFGVKGAALPQLAGHPRVQSADSQAYNDRARHCAFHREPCPARPVAGNPVSHTAFHLADWMERQRVEEPDQMTLLW